MMLNINEDKLKMLLKDKEKHIKKSYSEGVLTSASGLITIITDGIYGFDVINGNFKSSLLKFIIFVLGAAFIMKGLYDMVQVKKSPQTAESLYDDISKLDIPKSRYSLVAIKDTFNKYPKRYLVLYDERWECYLFPYYKTTNSDEEDIIKHLSLDLETNESDLSIEWKTSGIHTKYSVSNKRYKTYEHNLYQVNILNFNDVIKNNEFMIEGKRFKWLSKNEMLTDQNIIEKNSQIVAFVTDNVI